MEATLARHHALVGAGTALPPITCPKTPRGELRSPRWSKGSVPANVATHVSYTVNAALVYPSPLPPTTPRHRPRFAMSPAETMFSDTQTLSQADSESTEYFRRTEKAERERDILADRMSKVATEKALALARVQELEDRLIGDSQHREVQHNPLNAANLAQVEKAVSRDIWDREQQIVALLSERLISVSEKTQLLQDKVAMERELSNLKSEVAYLRANKDADAVRELELTKCQNDQLQTRVSSVKQIAAEAQAKLNGETVHSYRLEKDLRDATIAYEAAFDRLSQLKRENEENQQKAKAEKAALEQQLAETKQTMAKKIERLELQISNQEAAIRDLETAVSEKIRQLQRAHFEVDNARIMFDALKTKVAAIEAERDKVKREKAELEMRYADLEDAKAESERRLRHEIAELKAEHAKEKAEMQRKIEDLASQLDQALEDTKAMNQEYDRLFDKLAGAEEEKIVALKDKEELERLAKEQAEKGTKPAPLDDMDDKHRPMAKTSQQSSAVSLRRLKLRATGAATTPHHRSQEELFDRPPPQFTMESSLVSLDMDGSNESHGARSKLVLAANLHPHSSAESEDAAEEDEGEEEQETTGDGDALVSKLRKYNKTVRRKTLSVFETLETIELQRDLALKELDEMEKLKAELERQLAERDAEKAELLRRIAELEKQLADALSNEAIMRYRVQIQRLEEEKMQLLKELERWKEAKAQADEQIKLLNEQVEMLKALRSSLEDTIKRLQAQLNELQNAKDGSDARIRELEEELAMLRSLMQRYDNQAVDRLSQVKEMLQQAFEKLNRYFGLEKQVAELIEETINDLDIKPGTNTVLKQQLKQQQSVNSNLQAKVDDLSKAKTALEATITSLRNELGEDKQALRKTLEQLSVGLHRIKPASLIDDEVNSAEAYRIAVEQIMEDTRKAHAIAYQIIEQKKGEGKQVHRATERLLSSLNVQVEAYHNTGLV